MGTGCQEGGSTRREVWGFRKRTILGVSGGAGRAVLAIFGRRSCALRRDGVSSWLEIDLLGLVFRGCVSRWCASGPLARSISKSLAASA